MAALQGYENAARRNTEGKEGEVARKGKCLRGYRLRVRVRMRVRVRALRGLQERRDKNLEESENARRRKGGGAGREGVEERERRRGQVGLILRSSQLGERDGRRRVGRAVVKDRVLSTEEGDCGGGQHTVSVQHEESEEGRLTTHCQECRRGRSGKGCRRPRGSSRTCCCPQPRAGRRAHWRGSPTWAWSRQGGAC